MYHATINQSSGCYTVIVYRSESHLMIRIVINIHDRNLCSAMTNNGNTNQVTLLFFCPASYIIIVIQKMQIVLQLQQYYIVFGQKMLVNLQI